MASSVWILWIFGRCTYFKIVFVYILFFCIQVITLFFYRYWMQQPHVRKAMNLGTRKMSDGLEIYKAMIEDTMQSIKKELVEAMENYKVSKLFY